MSELLRLMTDKKQFTTLDYIDHIKVSGDVFIKPVNEYWALLCLWHGLENIYRQTLKIEIISRRIINPTNKYKVFCYGNVTAFENIPKELLTCMFHWYAVSACQYVRTVGTIAYKLNNEEKPINYIKKIIPEILIFRNKVAAHFAWSTKNKNDNDAERMISIFPPLSYSDGNWYVGQLILNMRKNGVDSSSKKIVPWSITKEHLKLMKRFWPETKET